MIFPFLGFFRFGFVRLYGRKTFTVESEFTIKPLH